ncbi:MAG: hypothetical protein Q4F21_12130 [Lachnospiraceae bacterium]|nr:hypothetical protein [Lachnospiraceae bacterium]
MSKRTQLLLKENNRLEEELSADSREILSDIVVYIRSANISPYYQEIVRRDIWQMILDGEARGVSASEIIGEDYKAFCDQVIDALPKPDKKEKLLTNLRDALLSLIVLLVIRFCFQIIHFLLFSEEWPYFQVTAGDVVSAVLILLAAFSVFTAISRNAFNNSSAFNKGLFAMIFVAMILCTCANLFLTAPLFQIHALAVAAGILIFSAAYKLLDDRLD